MIDALARAVIRQAVADAQRGDPRARAWLQGSDGFVFWAQGRGWRSRGYTTGRTSGSKR